MLENIVDKIGDFIHRLTEDDGFLKRAAVWLAIGWAVFSFLVAIVSGYEHGLGSILSRFLICASPASVMYLIWGSYKFAIWVIGKFKLDYTIPESPVSHEFDIIFSPRDFWALEFRVIQILFTLVTASIYIALIWYLE